MLCTPKGVLVLRALFGFRLVVWCLVVVTIACGPGCVIVPIPFPSYSRETLKAGKLHVRDAESKEVLPEALVLVVRTQQPGSVGYPKAFENEPIVAVTNAIIFRDGDSIVTKSTRGVRYVFDIHVKASRSSTFGFLVAAPGYAPKLFEPPAAGSSDEAIHWDLSPEESNRGFAALRGEITARGITLSQGPSGKAESQLSKHEEARAIRFIDKHQALASKSAS